MTPTEALAFWMSTHGHLDEPWRVRFLAHPRLGQLLALPDPAVRAGIRISPKLDDAYRAALRHVAADKIAALRRRQRRRLSSPRAATPDAVIALIADVAGRRLDARTVERWRPVAASLVGYRKAVLIDAAQRLRGPLDPTSLLRAVTERARVVRGDVEDRTSRIFDHRPHQPEDTALHRGFGRQCYDDHLT